LVGVEGGKVAQGGWKNFVRISVEKRVFEMLNFGVFLRVKCNEE